MYLALSSGIFLRTPMIKVEHPRWTTTSHKRSRTEKKKQTNKLIPLSKNTVISTSSKLPSNLSDWSVGVVHVLSSESFFKIYCKEAVYIEVVGDVATTCLSWKQVCLQTSQRFISKWKFHSEKVTKDVWSSENNLYVTDKFSACLTTIKLLGTHQASPAHCENDALYNLNQIFFLGDVCTQAIQFSDYFTLNCIIWKRLLPLKVTL